MPFNQRNRSFLLCTQEKKSELSSLYSGEEIRTFYSVLRRRNQSVLLCTQEKKPELSTLYSGEEIGAFYSVLRRKNQSFLLCTQEKKSERSTLYSGEEIGSFLLCTLSFYHFDRALFHRERTAMFHGNKAKYSFWNIFIKHGFQIRMNIELYKI